MLVTWLGVERTSFVIIMKMCKYILCVINCPMIINIIHRSKTNVHGFFFTILYFF
jgi:hypothetical protein